MLYYDSYVLLIYFIYYLERISDGNYETSILKVTVAQKR